ncbi:hypothetical protein ERICIV_01118 [Paenibacillus larvae subsp. larvae]|uniref:DUF1177 domain-containing protein n=2 Tax=Paenibacillus larvae subsp. larvae TaxID=147375 RepID=V9W7U8_9BACL|nr:DUF1177 domain-containing protein [Paenibacillus larvae]AHD07111.1 hypothetical protein ERIC2_c33750 [Paenibacillus larvae subsp. larvae DSM 25430]AQT85871.1 hypothetical protein B1222_17960 [Paenibacillus larvae subsp. pulvifaciens]AQZ45890.1 hypothetical protein B5S25_04025 [Paenibacillus larvae subsp. pulvifaciens]AVF25301.1 hypothetical protein ERICIII_01097 [Paenibacillus larvae subsp. larvae]AVF30078.1 hypothetical protein ERICIV_01118 [Paenibacillus larvae subsp. larvae]
MALKQTLTVYETLDSAYVTGDKVKELFQDYPKVSVTVQKITGEEGSTDFIKIVIPGSNGKSNGGDAPTFGIIGRLGGIGARPSRVGLVSDGDGAVAAVASALKLADMQVKGDVLPGDVIATTHICPDAPTQPHEPVDFMGSPVEMDIMNTYEILPEQEAILSIDTTKGNRVINHKGIALSPTVKEGYILRVSEDLLRIMEMTTGQLPVTFPITMQDITPYGNDVYHINSILQPAVATDAPVVGLAVSAQSAVPGCGTGASHEVDIASAVRFAVEVAKEYTQGTCQFYNEQEFARLTKLYGSMKVLQTMGKEA